MRSSFGALPPSSYRDRTKEFHTIADRLKKSHPSSANSSLNADGSSEGSKRLERSQKLQTFAPAQSEFNTRASQIGLRIHQTSQKLSKLAKLAKRTSMFDDPIVEIQELTTVIKQDITTLNSAILDLQRICDVRNGAANSSKHNNEHSSTVVDNLKSRLMGTTKDFKDILTTRTENLKVHESRRQLFSATPKGRVNSFVRHRPLTTKSTASTTNTFSSWSHDSTSSDSLSLRRQATSPPRSTYGHMEQQQVAVQATSYMQNRAEVLQNVESTISELSSIFTQLATMVAQQGEMVIRIDENMDDTITNVEGAQGALLTYLNRISSNRWLILKIFFVLIIFLLIFVFFMA